MAAVAAGAATVASCMKCQICRNVVGWTGANTGTDTLDLVVSDGRALAMETISVVVSSGSSGRRIGRHGFLLLSCSGMFSSVVSKGQGHENRNKVLLWVWNSIMEQYNGTSKQAGKLEWYVCMCVSL